MYFNLFIDLYIWFLIHSRFLWFFFQLLIVALFHLDYQFSFISFLTFIFQVFFNVFLKPEIKIANSEIFLQRACRNIC